MIVAFGYSLMAKLLADVKVPFQNSSSWKPAGRDKLLIGKFNCCAEVQLANASASARQQTLHRLIVAVAVVL